MSARRHWRRPRVVAVGGAVLLVATAGVVALLLGMRDDATSTPGPAASPSAADPDVHRDLAAIEAALNSGDAAAIRRILTREAAEGFPTTTVLPPGSVVDVEEESFVQSGEETAYATATVEGPAPGTHLLLLWRQDDAWRVVATAPDR